MKKISKTLVFFGSGPVASASLEFLISTYGVSAVVTKQKPAHHSDPAPVEELAKNHNIPLFYANTPAELDIVASGIHCQNSCGVVIDYGVIISQNIIDRFDHKIINSHFSLLPEWRGADPITYALLSGQTKTGVCLMELSQGLDTGNIIAFSTVDIGPTENSSSLTGKLITTSNRLINENLGLYLDGKISPEPQQTSVIATYSKKVSKKDGQISWAKPATVIEREIRAYNVWPKNHCLLGDIKVVLSKCQVSNRQIEIGELLVGAKSLSIGCSVGSLDILELVPLGKQKMSAAAFINGYRSKL